MYCKIINGTCPMQNANQEIDIKLMHLTNKYSSRRGEEIKYIVIHDTANYRQGAGALAHQKYFETTTREASCHYLVDDKNIIEIINPIYSAWHCGDGKGKFGIKNSNSIGIEMCVNSDSDYEKMLLNTILITKSLMEEYNILKDRVVRHFDASRKLCPISMSHNNWETWKAFKSLI